MKIIYCSSPLDERKVDESYEEEYTYAKQLGLDVGLIHLESLLLDGKPKRAIKNLTVHIEPTLTVYRGWMMKPSEYETLYNALTSINLYLINTPEQYQHGHYLPDSYDLIEPYTPRSVWIHQSEMHKSADWLRDTVQTFGTAPIMVKDYVKSRKHEWHVACYIPDASDQAHVQKVVQTFLERQGSDLNEGLVFREYAQLAFLSNHPQSGMPLSEEMRVFVLDGKPLYVSNYWDEGEDQDFVAQLESFMGIASTIQSRFFTMDFAKLTDGSWIILELGDGQVAGLPDYADVQQFYMSLKLAMIEV
ncbi:ATP-grasp domain-containing protein [Paenibacillus xylanexedens]|uniref:ATP-grasp domain-containing protein n=1 Tax=Paenibacillus xylanexedens TaxID=528191 RepID=UPI0011A78808|nr:ATP-grasp domain-containing protein [Paenibacillus xylanexedens]